jgi:hypothetical protein
MDSNVNKRHKDSVFSKLFSSPEILREVYSAINGVDVPPDAAVNINTLSEALYMKQINDISFTINDRVVVLIEHQSTINNNMPVRFLMYIGRVYEKIIDDKKRYQSKLVKIPAPEFIVLYDGEAPYPDYKELKLSLAFKDAEGLKQPDAPQLELTAKVYNINQGRNADILNKSKTLYGYSVFTGKAAEYRKKKPLEEAVKDAIKYCIGNGILKDFFKDHGSEVYNMLMGEWNMDDAKEVWQEEAFEDGMEEGLERGLTQGMEKGREEGKAEIIALLEKGVSLEEIKKQMALGKL